MARFVLPTPLRRSRCLVAALALLWATPTRAENFLIEVSAGSTLVDTVVAARYGHYELSGGAPAPLRQWYGSKTHDLRLVWLDQITPDFGLIWGFSTGETGQKYQIAPGFQLGIMWQRALTRRQTISLRASTRLGGRLTEQSCTADYGAIGGIQEVNCRMAASILPPAETLDYLWDESPADLVKIELSWTFRF